MTATEKILAWVTAMVLAALLGGAVYIWSAQHRVNAVTLRIDALIVASPFATTEKERKMVEKRLCDVHVPGTSRLEFVKVACRKLHEEDRKASRP